MKKEFQTKHSDLKKEVLRKIRQLITDHGIKSEFRSDKVLKVTSDRLQFTLDDNKDLYLTEISSEGLISTNGYDYDFDTLTLEHLCELVDYFLEFKP